MDNQITLSPIPGTPEYFAARKVAFALIREVEIAKQSADRAPTYIAGRWDEDNEDYEPVENTKPWDHLDKVQTMAKAGNVQRRGGKAPMKDRAGAGRSSHTA